LSRIFESKVLFAIFIISLLWTISLFAVPLLIPPGTVADLDGHANRVDYGHIWDTLPPHVGIIYLIGDAECHQISERTIYINGNQMPVCARDFSIFFFLTVGLFVGMMSRRDYYLSKGILSVFPGRLRDWVNHTIGAKWFSFILVFLCLLPLALDGSLQLFTGYESNNAVRILTGLPVGLVAGLLVAVMIKSVKATREYRKEMEKEKVAQPEA
ncbi:MAG: DUF2085 domain-containing protein, partial [Methanobacteriota archaeon]